MLAKKCDMMVANTVDAALETDTTSVRILYPNGKDKIILKCAKQDAALEIVKLIAERIKK
jgi:phosphopantothenoylcysteine synthetase/decarboxylase